MKNVSLVLCLLISCTMMPQRMAQKMADNLFDEMSYASAVDYYKDLAGTKTPSEDNLRRLAVCYYKLQHFDKAEQAYARLSAAYPQALSESDLINRIQCLKSQGKYSQVEQVMKKLSDKNKSSLFLAAHRLNPGYETKLKKDSLRYNIFNVKDVNTEYSEFYPYLYGKDKTLMMVSNRRNVAAKNKTFGFDDTYFTDIYTAGRKDSLSFDDANPLARKVSTKYHDGPAIVSTDGNKMYITRTNYLNHKLGKSSQKITNLKLLMFTKMADGEWDEGTPFPFCSDEYSLGHAALSLDEKRLYFISDMPGGYGQTDLWYSDFEKGAWQKPVNLGSDVNTEGQEMFPYINEQGILFFASNGYAGLGGLDVCYSFPGAGSYLEGKLLDYPVNTRFDDFGFYVNPDLKTGYFSSNRPGGKGKDDIYYFNSGSPLFGIYVEGKIRNAYSKDAVTGAKVKLLDQNGKVIDSARTTPDGRYQMPIPDPSKQYTMTVEENAGYSAQSLSLKALEPGKNEKEILVYPKYVVACLVTEGRSNQPLDGVKASLTDRVNNEKFNYVTGADGRFNSGIKDKKAGDHMRYTVRLEKPGYITSVQDVDIVLDTAVVIDLHKMVNAGLEKMKKGTDIGKIVKINPIYFDVAKWDIKPEAAKELDKIVSVMIENPTMRIELGSHTDCRSAKAYNMQLSEKRAKASASYIISKGIDKSRIYGKGYGETQLINACACEGAKIVPCTEEQHQQNRRTEFIVVTF